MLRIDTEYVDRRLLAMRWTKADLAREMETSRQALGNVLIRGKNCSLKWVERLAKGLGVDYTEILTDID